MKQRGFTLIEVLVYAGLSSILIGLFAGILITTTRIQTQQSSSTNIASEMNFVLGTIKRTVNDSTTITVPQPNELNLTTQTNPGFTTRIYEQDNILYLEKNAPAERLTSDRIFVEEVIFTDLSIGESQAIAINIIARSNTTNPQASSTREFQTMAIPFLQAQ